MNIKIRPIQPADYSILDDFLYHAIFIPEEEEIPATADISDKISKDLKKLGMNFVGSTIIYSFMQATGMVNDHLTYCFVYGEFGYCINFSKEIKKEKNYEKNLNIIADISCNNHNNCL